MLGEWTGYVPFAALPSVLDPEGGLLATANARITPDGYPYQLTLEWAAPYRNERIWKWLGSHRALTRDDMLRLQTDVFSEVAPEIAARLAGWSQPALRYTRGVLAKYARVVAPASRGAVTD